ncbi:hypothetical protein [Haloferula sp. BvORR071]|uniref:hypothetical protein n=1 Tax=Haloferula sp. BvORR071 TaxID=1396141 RepID=UPI00055212FA|nr:hypothetical protein [Haloferula sp. BvORR071]
MPRSLPSYDPESDPSSETPTVRLQARGPELPGDHTETREVLGRFVVTVAMYLVLVPLLAVLFFALRAFTMGGFR